VISRTTQQPPRITRQVVAAFASARLVRRRPANRTSAGLERHLPGRSSRPAARLELVWSAGDVGRSPGGRGRGRTRARPGSPRRAPALCERARSELLLAGGHPRPPAGAGADSAQIGRAAHGRRSRRAGLHRRERRSRRAFCARTPPASRPSRHSRAGPERTPSSRRPHCPRSRSDSAARSSALRSAHTSAAHPRRGTYGGGVCGQPKVHVFTPNGAKAPLPITETAV
jgi:hypothetical protein